MEPLRGVSAPRSTTAHRGKALSAGSPGPAPEYVHDRPGFAYDTAVSALSRRTDVATARWTAKVLELPADGVGFEGRAWPWLPTALPVALVLLGAAAVVVVRRVRAPRAARRPS